MFMRAACIGFSLVFCFAVFAEEAAKDSVDTSNDRPGQLRYDEDGLPQLWGGPELREIESTGDMKLVLAGSHRRPIFIFKHSTTCPISARAAARLNAYAGENADKKPVFYWVKVIETRPASQALAEAVEVEHESPQILLIEDGKAVWNTSHDEITAEAMDAAIEKHLAPVGD